MSVLSRRAREQDDARRRALLGIGDSVFAAVTKEMPLAGSLAVEKAVETALNQILKKGAHRCDLEFAKRWWISWAKLRMIDGGRLSESRERDPIPVDEHPAALAHSILEDPLELDAVGLDAVGLQEILRSLSGRQREWADGLFGLLRQPAIDDERAAKLHEVLGWTPEMTRKTGQRARETIKAFIEERASGAVCSRRQAVLDAFIMATEPLYRAAAPVDVDIVDCRQFQAVVVHLAGCPECQAVWSRRRATLLQRCASAALLPIDALTAAAQAFAGRLADAVSGAQNAALSVLARLGIGGGGVVAGGSALTARRRPSASALSAPPAPGPLSSAACSRRSRRTAHPSHASTPSGPHPRPSGRAPPRLCGPLRPQPWRPHPRRRRRRRQPCAPQRGPPCPHRHLP
jgi:hypothetical protein